MSQPDPFKDELVRAVARNTYSAGKDLVKVAIILGIGISIAVPLAWYLGAKGYIL